MLANPFADLRVYCADNGCTLTLRVETFDGTVHHSLMAIRDTDGRRVYDVRSECLWDEQAGAIEALIERAAKEWWP